MIELVSDAREYTNRIKKFSLEELSIYQR
jgi:hypothetical protein